MQHGLPTLPLGHALQGRYQIIKKLGAGGYGSVYLAEDQRLRGRQVAVKELSDPSESAQQLFKQEAQVLAALDHPGLVRVSDFFGEGRSYYLVMDYIAGRDLLDLVVDAEKQRRHLPIDKAVGWMIQVCDAVAYLHHQQPPIIHRDIKPNNVRLTQKDRAVLVDFGIAKIDPKAKTQVMAKAVSQGFSPPEQYGAGGSGTDARSDVYALGATLYCLLTLTPPPDSFDRLMRGTALSPPRQINTRISPTLETVVLQAMSVNVAQRYRDAGELLMALQAATGRPVTQQAAAVSARRQLVSYPGVQHTPAPPSRTPAPAAGVKPPLPATPPKAPVADSVSPTQGVACPQCSALVRLGARFCPQCGKTMDTARRCFKCNMPYRSGARFCAKCGGTLPLTTPREVEAVSAPPVQTPAPPAEEIAPPPPPPPPDFVAEGLQHAQAGRFKEAATAFEAALEEGTSSAAVVVSLGHAYAELRQFEAAIVALEKGLQQHPQDAELHAALGRALLSAEQPAAGLEHLEQAVGLASGDDDLVALAAMTAFELGRYRAAAANFERLMRTYSQDPLFRGRLAVCYLLTERVAEGERLVQDLTQQESLPAAELEFLKGLVNFKKGSQRWAMRNFRDVLRLDATHALAEYFVGEIYFEWKRWREAVEAYERSAALDPRAPLPHARLSACGRKLGDSAKAEAALQQALALDPEGEVG